MKLFVCSIAVMAALAGCGGGQSSNKQDTQFNTDLGRYMNGIIAKKGLDGSVTAVCKPIENGRNNCDILIHDLTGKVIDKATAENVRREGNKFVWDKES